MTLTINRLSTINGNGKSISYDYDASGERFKKTVNGVMTEFTYLGGQLQAMKTGTDVTYFYYSADGMRLAIQYNDTLYYYQYNAHGDVMRLIDGNGNYVVEYVYDSWGKLVRTEGSLAYTLGKANPFRYRSYFYDEETGWYYLHNRYYVPEWGRFLNMDTSIYVASSALSMNQYAYCANDPVNFSDPSGKYMSMEEWVNQRGYDPWRDYYVYGIPLPEAVIQEQIRKHSILASIIGVWAIGSGSSSTSSSTSRTVSYTEQVNHLHYDDLTAKPSKSEPTTKEDWHGNSGPYTHTYYRNNYPTEEAVRLASDFRKGASELSDFSTRAGMVSAALGFFSSAASFVTFLPTVSAAFSAAKLDKAADYIETHVGMRGVVQITVVIRTYEGVITSVAFGGVDVQAS